MMYKTNPEREEYVINTVLKPLGIRTSRIKDGSQSLERVMTIHDEKDAADQKSRERNLCLEGLPEEQDEEGIKDKLIQLFKNQLEISDIEPSDIENMYWIGRKRTSEGTSSRKLIVCFTSRKMRNQVYQRRKSLLRSSDTKNIYIHSDLTPFVSKLYYEARRLVKAKKIHAAWEEFGNIMVLPTGEDIPEAVYSYEQLAEMCSQRTNDEAINSDYNEKHETNPEREGYVINTVLKPLGIGLRGIEDVEDGSQALERVMTRHRQLIKPDEKDAADQKSREKNLCFMGLPEEQDEERIKDRLIQLLKNQVGVTYIEPSDIEKIYWGSRFEGISSRRLIVCFTSKEMRDLVYQHRRRKLMNPDTKTIYLHEDLTPLRQQLLYEARKLVKAKKIHAAWIECGNVMVQRTEEDIPEAVYSYEQLAEMRRK